MKRSVEINPNDAHARQRLAWMFASNGKMDKAVDEATYARNLNPQSTFLNLYVARMLALSDQPAKSKTYLQKTLEIDPNSSDAKWNMVKVLEQIGEFSEAEKGLKEFEKTAKGPFRKRVRLMIGRLYARSNRTKEARLILNEILANEKENEQLDFVAGTIHIILVKTNWL